MSRSRRMWMYGVAIAGLCVPAAAQIGQPTPNFGSNFSFREDPASALARYLRMVTANPRDLEALTGAGNAALKVGDAQAAIGFYARAEAIAPRNGRVKAGLGSALVLLNQEQAALRYFDEAVALGVPEADVASDRGLAYDLRGNSKRAQRDYGVALRRGEDAETTRRLAMSMAITGDSNGALVLLDPLLRKQDTAAWRARAFILAMSGDAAGANKAAEAVMPANTAAGFAPFFRKLPSLRAGEKAAAVHFGHFPGEGRPMRIDDLFNQAEVAARVALENTPRSATDAGQVDSSQGAFGRLASRTPNEEGQLAVKVAPRPSAQITAPVIVTPRTNAVTQLALRQSNDARIAAALTPRVAEPVRTTTVAPLPRVNVLPPAVAASSIPVSVQPVTVASTAAPGFGSPSPSILPPQLGGPTRLADVAATVGAAASEPLVRAVELPPSTVPVLPQASEPVVATPLPQTLPATRLADVAVTLTNTPRSTAPIVNVAVPPAPQPKVEIASTAVPPAPLPKVETPAVIAPPASRPKVETAPAAATAIASTPEASRVWVQVAGGADERALPFEWRRLKTKAPELLNAQTAWTTPLKATNRLLVGPFGSEKEAQDFVNKLKPKGITAFTWTSPQDQAIAKLASR